MSGKKKEKGKSFLETVREIDAAERKAELEEESRCAEERLKREEQARKAYEEQLKRERLELMKRRQGLSEKEEQPTEPKPKKQYTLREKISNFFYHNKVYVIFGVLGISLAAFLTYDISTKETPDLSVFFIATDYTMDMYSSRLTELWSQYCPDKNGDGKQIAKLYYVPANYEASDYASMNYAQSDRTKIFGEFQSGTTIIIIGNKQAFADLGVYDNGVFYDAEELFPGDAYAEKTGYRLAGTDFAELIGYPEMEDEELYVSFRTPRKTMGNSEETMQENFDTAVEFWKAFIAEHRVDGLTLPETPEPVMTYNEYDEEYYYTESILNDSTTGEAD